MEIRPVDAGKAVQFIRARVDDATRWQPVLDTITNHPGGSLAVGLSTPWRLTLATTVYEQREPETGSYIRDPVALIRLGTIGPEAIRDHLLEHFVPAAIAAHLATAEHSEQPYSDEQVHQWLRVLAGYLDHNAKTGRTLGGVPLSGTDLVLHQLWPLAGVNRVRTLELAATVLIWLVATPILVAQNGIGFSARQLMGAGVPLGGLAYFAYSSWSELWPTPLRRIDTRKLRTRHGRHRLGLGLVFGLVSGLVGGLGLVSELVGELVSGLVLGLMGVLTGTRYVAFLLCTRRPFTTHPLPWRLGHFLNWCYHLIRQAGISYQFRHRELQHYLARH